MELADDPEIPDLPWPELSARAVAHLQTLTAGHEHSWHLPDAAWAVELSAGVITFTTPELTATAPVQVVGTHDPRDGSWWWGWDHPSVPPGRGADAELVRRYGERHGIPFLTTRRVRLTDVDPWELTAVAALLGEAQGAYRGPTNTAEVFMTFGHVTLRRAPGAAALPWASLVVPVDGISEPELMGPSGGWSAEPHLLTEPEPPVTADQVVAFVQDYLRRLNPVYYVGRYENPTRDEKRRMLQAQEPIRQGFWRRRDDFFTDTCFGTDHQLDLDRATDWRATHLGPRLWQVSWVRWEIPDAQVDDALLERARNEYVVRRVHEGMVVMAYDDGLRLVDQLFGKSEYLGGL